MLLSCCNSLIGLSSIEQDLINQMIELEKHFNTLEMNIFGERSRVNLVSRALSAKSVPSRYELLYSYSCLVFVYNPVH